MLQIPCPWCGVRDEIEFVFGGPSDLMRPPADVSDTAWADYLFCRDNPKGPCSERWCHRFGCGGWFNLSRDTLTHEILAVASDNEPDA